MRRECWQRDELRVCICMSPARLLYAKGTSRHTKRLCSRHTQIWWAPKLQRATRDSFRKTNDVWLTTDYCRQQVKYIYIVQWTSQWTHADTRRHIPIIVSTTTGIDNYHSKRRPPPHSTGNIIFRTRHTHKSIYYTKYRTNIQIAPSRSPYFVYLVRTDKVCTYILTISGPSISFTLLYIYIYSTTMSVRINAEEKLPPIHHPDSTPRRRKVIIGFMVQCRIKYDVINLL